MIPSKHYSAPPQPAWCHVCMADTPTAYLALSSGHVGNCCALCRATRKGHPFAPRSVLATNPPMPEGAIGESDATKSR